ncbi:MAG: LysE family transporter [Burkholderiaceae bacterium]|nr:LysE family transporter [Burkholderiaceae bacterium]
MTAALVTIAVLHWAVLLVPGFNFVLIGQLAAGGARRAALAAVVGMTTGTLMWALLAVAGVGAVFSTHPVLRQVAQVVGGIYLLVLARNLWRSGGSAPSVPDRVVSALSAFRAGFFTSVLNPKIALFYGSVFATALPADPPARMAAAAVALVYLNSWVWHGALALVLSLPGVQNAYSARHRALTRGSAVLVGAFGLRWLVTALLDGGARLP